MKSNNELIDFGNDALYNGKEYAFLNPNLTSKQRGFLNYLFSEQRKYVVPDEVKAKTVQPEDIAAYNEQQPKSNQIVEANKKAEAKDVLKPKNNPKDNPTETQK